MQTFLPYPDFQQSAIVLDWRRHGKQRVEVLQLLKALHQGPVCLYDTRVRRYAYGIVPSILPEGYVLRRTPWYNHPAARMWRGYGLCLIRYGAVICHEWKRKGGSDTCEEKISRMSDWFSDDTSSTPPWLGREDFHAAHRSNLLRKDSVYYGQFGWKESSDLPYVWPV